MPLLVARRTEELEAVKAEIERAGGQAWVYSCDITDGESVDALVKAMLGDHSRGERSDGEKIGPDTGIDMLVNNAGRSIRRSVRHSNSTGSTTSSARWPSTTSAPCGSRWR